MLALLNGRVKYFLRRSLSQCPVHAVQQLPLKGDRVVIAMSGGVDSSVAAKLLAESDFDLSAIFMRNWDTRDESGSDKGCEWEKDWEDVQRVCRLLDLPCQMVDLSTEYWNRVFEPSLRFWESGTTPNPDVWCNRQVKFGALLDQLSAGSSSSWLATGHYARKSWSDDLPSRPKLLRAVDWRKDQTYYLSSIREKSLARAMFPIGHLTKMQVRELAHKHRLPTANREESMGVCFIGEKRRFHDFLSQYLMAKPGPIIDVITGERVGTHDGLWTYTIGQGAKIRGMPEKMYVSHKDATVNTVYVVPGTDHQALYCDRIKISHWNWIWANPPPPGLDESTGIRLTAQFRHNMPEVPATMHQDDDGSIVLVFNRSQKAVAPGQVAAVWDGEWCLGSGIIAQASLKET